MTRLTGLGINGRAKNVGEEEGWGKANPGILYRVENKRRGVPFPGKLTNFGLLIVLWT
jgi:hypothetical protein